MPIDLRPCEIPSYQPTFDLTKQKFLPARNIPTVRELVKVKQDERFLPPKNEFVSRMEDSLMRWKPPASSYRGTTMAIEGLHPYQLPTSKLRDQSRENGSYVMDSFVNWWRGSKSAHEPRSNNDKDKRNAGGDDSDSNDRDDQFSLNYDPNYVESSATGTARSRTPYAVIPPRTPRPATLVDHVPDDTVYQLYYGKPIPPDYLSRQNRCNFNDLQQHEQVQQDPSEWLKNCFSSCTNM